jgi:hypothetical protein
VSSTRAVDAQHSHGGKGVASLRARLIAKHEAAEADRRARPTPAKRPRRLPLAALPNRNPELRQQRSAPQQRLSAADRGDHAQSRPFLELPRRFDRDPARQSLGHNRARDGCREPKPHDAATASKFSSDSPDAPARFS